MKNNSLILVVVAFLMITSCQNKKAAAELEELKAEQQLPEQNKKLAERWHNDLFLACNWEVAEEILAPDIVVHFPSGEDMKGLEQVKVLETISQYVNVGDLVPFENERLPLHCSGLRLVSAPERP